eukprot:CAMPEP_0177250448 /NCGR_PEP_ID=MMETSP0367-20130122/53349_1 /TAXON_ID=447022 ORGANISM="Scrippsiella hangoei-like, Strain SHHI-4" /NCGR_SAMPLE_ID=MMETSP0367 /ASSEMBLY_ACC=CAM_ASM_000362 /LENGTH=178 /DNA_ID=CAMNT_0018703137 /DNA_START=1 /DNA_END=537 /DNA_ORIENTATION=+
MAIAQPFIKRGESVCCSTLYTSPKADEPVTSATSELGSDRHEQAEEPVTSAASELGSAVVRPSELSLSYMGASTGSVTSGDCVSQAAWAPLTVQNLELHTELLGQADTAEVAESSCDDQDVHPALVLREENLKMFLDMCAGEEDADVYRPAVWVDEDGCEFLLLTEENLFWHNDIHEC